MAQQSTYQGKNVRVRDAREGDPGFAKGTDLTALSVPLATDRPMDDGTEKTVKRTRSSLRWLLGRHVAEGG
jgi:hypothetical protein